MKLVKPSYEILSPLNRMQILKFIELVGRVCYKSEEKITNDSASKFVKSLVKRGHESVLEHVTISVRFIVDRGVSHELVRHRIAAYSQESTRYCNYSDGVTFVIPPWVAGVHAGVYKEPQDFPKLDSISRGTWRWLQAMVQAEVNYQQLQEEGWKKPEQVRSVLPNSLKTEIIATMNLRQWRHVLRLRTSRAAHPQMREVMVPLLHEMHEVLPEVFEDIQTEK